jgi:hypothetical protein
MNVDPRLLISAVSLLALVNSANAADLVYGQSYHILNGAVQGTTKWTGGFLDTAGGGCQGNFLCVSTAKSYDRSNNSGTWMIKSATGKPDGTTVYANDQVYLLNQYNGNGGYLDTDGNVCGGLYCVSTAHSSNRNSGSGTWLLIKGQWETGPIAVGDAVRLMNNYLVWSGGYLNTTVPGCQGNLLCVNTVTTFSNGDKDTTIWQFGSQ